MLLEPNMRELQLGHDHYLRVWKLPNLLSAVVAQMREMPIQEPAPAANNGVQVGKAIKIGVQVLWDAHRPPRDPKPQGDKVLEEYWGERPPEGARGRVREVGEGCCDHSEEVVIFMTFSCF